MTKKEREERAAIRLATVKRLFARSLNRCAFPGCNSMIVDDESDAMLGEMCHIEGIGKKALRHNKTLTKEERDAYSNLILLCSNHHKVIDHDKSYTVESLRRMKSEHEKIGRMETDPKDARCAKICIERMNASKAVSTSTRTYNNSPHYEAKDQARQTFIYKTTINQKTIRKKSYPDGSIGSDNDKANYLSYLVDKYTEYAAWGHQGKKAYYIMPGMLRKHFRLGGHRSYLNISVDRFYEAVKFVQESILNTQLGRMKKSHQRLFRTYEEYLSDQ